MGEDFASQTPTRGFALDPIEGTAPKTPFLPFHFKWPSAAYMHGTK